MKVFFFSRLLTRKGLLRRKGGLTWALNDPVANK